METKNKTTLAHYWIKKAKRSVEAAARELQSNNEKIPQKTDFISIDKKPRLK